MKTLFLFVSTIFILSIITPFSHVQDESKNKEIHIPKIQSSALNVDGIVDDDVWKNAAGIDTFEDNNQEKSLPEKTTVYVYYDDEALYLAFEFEDRDIQSTYTIHDANLWDEEAMELFIYPHTTIPNPIQYFELQWNPLGTVFDGIITNKMNESGKSIKRDLDRGWNADGMKHAIHVEGPLNQSSDQAKIWSGEITIPFKTLGQGTPKPGDIWRANFYRYSRNTNEPITLIAWNPTRSTFHEPNRFGKLIFQ
jgi:hypothetical protein